MEETFHIDTVCHSGRPSDPRSAKETACYDLLDSLGIAYERVDHDAAMTMELCHAAEGVLHISICKNLFLCNLQKTKFYLLLMPGGKPFHTKDLSSQLGCARLSFGPPEDMERLLGVTPGSATVLALQNDTAGEGALVCAAMDARRSQIYNALFEIRGGKPVRLCEDRAISLAELGEELGKMQKSAFLVGDGAQLCYNTCLDMGIPAVLAPGNLVSQSAWGVAMAAFGQTPAPAEELLPVYLRLSQAERERQARLAAQAAQE